MVTPDKEARKRTTARIPTNMRATLEKAAELSGSTVNQFIVQAAFQEAQRILERETVIRLSQEDSRQVLALLDAPPKPTRRLKQAVAAFRKPSHA
jgi:uncharacterized protein (DUF1778 family)